MPNTKLSLWPRQGGDHANRSRIKVPGPSVPQIIKRIPLSGVLSENKGLKARLAGGAVSHDGSLRISFRGYLHALSAEGLPLWRRNLIDYELEPDLDDDDFAEEDSIEEDSFDQGQSDDMYDVMHYHSLPTVLANGHTLVTTRNSAVIFDQAGEVARHIHVPIADDTGLPPNYNHEGIPILTSVAGEVWSWEGEQLRELGWFGYDIEPVAIFADNTIAIAGYAGSGFCRITATGEKVWQTDLKDADLFPSINQAQYSAVGSLNDRCSVIFDPDGKPVGSYPHAAIFAEYCDGGWIARSKKHIARLSPLGSVVWQRPLDAPEQTIPHRYQPVVDSNGRIYIFNREGLLALAGNGDQIFHLAIDGVAGPLFPIRAGLFGTVVNHELLYIGE